MIKKTTLYILLLPFIGWTQINIGNNQTICLNDTAQIMATISGTASGCSGTSDSLVTQVAGGNGSAGTTFNVINTSGSPLEITGISQGGTYVMTNNAMEVWMYAGDIYATPLPIGTPPYPGWNLVGSANVNTTGTANSFGYIPISGVTIPTGGTYSFRVQRMTSGSVSYTNGTGTPGITAWASDANITITEGNGGSLTDWFAFSPRCFNGAVHYGGGASWIDLSSGITIGSGDSLLYSPSQTTDICAILSCNGITYSDTMTINVLNTNISTTGFSLCNGPIILTAPNNFSSYIWNAGSNSNIFTVSNPGTYYVDCVTNTGLTCQSEPVTIYQNIIPVNLSTPDSIFICQGDTVLIEAASGFNQYTWNTGSTTPSITAISPGNYNVSVVDGNGCTGTSDTTTISMSPQTINASSTGHAICPTNSSIILDAGTGFISYQWYNNGILLNNATNQTYIATNAGNYTVEVTYPTGCTATSNIITIYTGQFYFSINAIGNDSLCLPNGSIVLNAGNYSSYNWSTGSTTQQINVNSLGSYHVNVTDINGCSGVSNPPFIVHSIVNTSPISGPINTTQFQTETYSVIPQAGSTYNWDVIGATIQSGNGTNSIDITWDNPGMFSFSVIETDENGCIGDEMSILVDVIISSIEDKNTKEQDIYKTTDVLGREITSEKNTLLLHIYQNGTVEKKIIIE